MKRVWMMRLAAAAMAVAASSLANAAAFNFSGSMTGNGILSPNASCAPAPFQGMITAAPGSSNLGAFAYSQTTCTYGATGPVTGTFLVNFGADQFFGNLAGGATPDATTGVFDLIFDYTVTGGTGRFAGASGEFVGAGTGDTRVRPSIVSLSFSAVPEPATWAMMLLGFGAVGIATRRTRNAAKPLQLA